jgi:DNA-binding transcriptional ArsR family regulator
MSTDSLSLAFGALADPTRRALLARLAKGEATVAQLAEPFAMSSPAISKHLKVLERAGLVEVGRSATARPRKLAAGPMRDAAGWLEHYRPYWESTLDNLEDYVRELKAERDAGGRPEARRTARRAPRQRKESK